MGNILTSKFDNIDVKSPNSKTETTDAETWRPLNLIFVLYR